MNINDEIMDIRREVSLRIYRGYMNYPAITTVDAAVAEVVWAVEVEVSTLIREEVYS